MSVQSVNLAVQDRYSQAAQEFEQALCCPVANYDPQLLAVIPEEVLERDYGCGDPSRFVQAGDTVLDLGSGGGKICFIASQIVGRGGKVIGLDRNRDMLSLAEWAKPQVAEQTGFKNVEFRIGNIQDLALNLAKVESWLAQHPVQTREDLFALEQEQRRLRKEEPLIEDESIDIVLSNCVLNLVGEEDRQQLFKELFRVVKKGGRVAISDIVCDEDVPEHLKANERLWSGCISGAFREDEFVQAFADAGFYGVEIVKRDPKPWQVVEGIEFRAMTVVAYKGKEGSCMDAKHAIVYPGPWKEVRDDDGHVFRRGVREAVCEKTYQILTKAPYREQILGLPPYRAVPAAEQVEMTCAPQERPAQETKNDQLPPDYEAVQDCCSGGSCC